ncbi:MAG: tRNA (adenosine(37)-N6)-threonylcarbamoyltransferase complex ATPase subunit type 1 TsaE [Pirellulaceae bacterium]
MNPIHYEARRLAETDALGAALAELVPDGTTIALCGTLGAGKTRLVQAIAECCGIARQNVVSPTFVLCQEYHGTRSIYHFDAYRLRDEEEFRQLGPDECFQSPALVLIEWADRVEGMLPSERLEIHIAHGADDTRQFEITGYGSRLEPVIHRLRERLRTGAPA